MAFTVVSAIITGLIGIALALFKYSVDQADRQVREKMSALEREIKDLTAEVNRQKIETVQAQGQLELVKQSAASFVSDLEEIKKSMLTKFEYELRMNNTDKMIGIILGKLDPRYASSDKLPSVRTSDPRGERR